MTTYNFTLNILIKELALYSSRCIMSKLSLFQVATKNKHIAYIIHGYWTLRIFTPRPVMRMRAIFFCICFPSCEFLTLVDIDRLLKSISKILSAKEEFHAFSRFIQYIGRVVTCLSQSS